MITEYAPIFVSVYDRFDHLVELIESLKRNPEAKHSILYVSSDAAADIGARSSVTRIREYLNGLTGFKEVKIFAPQINTHGLIISEVKKEIFKEYDSMIRIEDDNIVSVKFLKYMNEGLKLYRHDKRVFSICGYVAPGCEKVGIQVVSGVKMHNPWGYGIWRDRWLEFDPAYDFRDEFCSETFKTELKSAGRFLYDSLIIDLNGWAKAEDARVCAHVIRGSMLSVYPPKSLVKNTGLDGSGLRAKKMRRFSVELNDNVLFSFPKKVSIDYEYTDKLKAYMDRSKFHYLLRCLGIYRLRYYLKTWV